MSRSGILCGRDAFRQQAPSSESRLQVVTALDGTGDGAPGTGPRTLRIPRKSADGRDFRSRRLRSDPRARRQPPTGQRAPWRRMAVWRPRAGRSSRRDQSAEHSPRRPPPPGRRPAGRHDAHDTTIPPCRSPARCRAARAAQSTGQSTRRLDAGSAGGPARWPRRRGFPCGT